LVPIKFIEQTQRANLYSKQPPDNNNNKTKASYGAK